MQMMRARQEGHLVCERFSLPAIPSTQAYSPLRAIRSAEDAIMSATLLAIDFRRKEFTKRAQRCVHRNRQAVTGDLSVTINNKSIRQTAIPLTDVRPCPLHGWIFQLNAAFRMTRQWLRILRKMSVFCRKYRGVSSRRTVP